LRSLVVVCAIAGTITTILGLQEAWRNGLQTGGRFGKIPQEIWAVLPYVLLTVISLFRISKRSLSTLLVTTLLAWFMSTGYQNLDQMDLVAMAIPLIQLAFVAGALAVMFTFWLLRKRKV
jgi:lysylphosphatidylglycerol synthetase-like protein (DUF2156 family)